MRARAKQKRGQMLTLRGMAQELGGEVNGSKVLAPGPGHGKRDRSLCVSLGRSGLPVVSSFAGDDWQVCRDYVMQRLGMSREARAPARRKPVSRLTDDEERYAKARELWHGARTDELRQQLRAVYPNLFKDDAAWDEALRLIERDKARNQP